VIKTEVKISFFKPFSMIALLKNIMIKGIQTLERRVVNMLWTERRYPLSIKISPEIRDPAELASKSLRRR
jgi:hypothetical protein